MQGFWVHMDGDIKKCIFVEKNDIARKFITSNDGLNFHNLWNNYSHFTKLENNFAVENASEKEVSDLISKEKDQLNNLMKKQIIPQTIEAIYEQDFPNLLQRMEFKITRAVEEMKQERIIYSEDKYDSPIKLSELSEFNPRELVQVSILKEFSEQTTQLKSSVVDQLGHLQSEIYELSGIIEYNLDSALNSQDEEENSQ